MSGRNDHNADRQSDLAIMGVEEYKQKRRLERILDVVDHVDEEAKEAWDMFVTGEIQHGGKNIKIQRAVKEAIRVCYNLLIEHQEKQLENEENGNPLGSKYWAGRPDEPIGVIEKQSGEKIPIWGLKDFLETDHFYTEEWVENVERRNMPNKTNVYKDAFTVPEDVSWEAALRLKEFLGRVHGIEIQFEALEVDEHGEVW